MKQLFDIIFSDLRASNKNLNRILSVGILFALAGHFYVVVPYSQYKKQERILSKQHGEIEDTIQQANIIFDHIKRLIRDYPGHLLYQTLPKIKQTIVSDSSSRLFQIELPSGIKQLDMPAKILGMDDPEEKLNHAIRWYVETWFTALMRELQNEAVAPIANLISQFNNGKKRVEELKVGKIVDQQIHNLRDFLEGPGSKILSLYTGENPKIVEILQNRVQGAFEPVADAVSWMLKMTTEHLKQFNEKIETLKSQVDSFKSQFGPVPVGLTDFIILFPIALVVLVVLFTYAFNKNSQLYIGLWREFTKDNLNSDIDAFQKIADCWYLPPSQNIFQPLLLRLSLVIIAVIFVWASLLIIRAPELFAVTDGPPFVTVFMFSGIYGIGILVIAACMWYIMRKTLRTITQEKIR